MAERLTILKHASGDVFRRAQTSHVLKLPNGAAGGARPIKQALPQNHTVPLGFEGRFKFENNAAARETHGRVCPLCYLLPVCSAVSTHGSELF